MILSVPTDIFRQKLKQINVVKSKKNAEMKRKNKAKKINIFVELK